MVDIEVPEDVLVRRLAARRICGSCGVNAPTNGRRRAARAAGRWSSACDDGDGIVRGAAAGSTTRQTRPIVEFYAGRPTFRAIDGDQPPDAVTAAMDAAICQAAVAVPGEATA